MIQLETFRQNLIEYWHCHNSYDFDCASCDFHCDFCKKLLDKNLKDFEKAVRLDEQIKIKQELKQITNIEDVQLFLLNYIIDGGNNG